MLQGQAQNSRACFSLGIWALTLKSELFLLLNNALAIPHTAWTCTCLTRCCSNLQTPCRKFPGLTQLPDSFTFQRSNDLFIFFLPSLICIFSKRLRCHTRSLLHRRGKWKHQLIKTMGNGRRADEPEAPTSQVLFQKGTCAGEQINKASPSCSAPELLGRCDRWELGQDWCRSCAGLAQHHQSLNRGLILN